jgi:hypothetical protein
MLRACRIAPSFCSRCRSHTTVKCGTESPHMTRASAIVTKSLLHISPQQRIRSCTHPAGRSLNLNAPCSQSFVSVLTLRLTSKLSSAQAFCCALLCFAWLLCLQSVDAACCTIGQPTYVGNGTTASPFKLATCSDGPCSGPGFNYLVSPGNAAESNNSQACCLTTTDPFAGVSRASVVKLLPPAHTSPLCANLYGTCYSVQ